MDTTIEVVDQPFDAESVGDSEDADLVPLQSGEDWVAQLVEDLSRPASQSGEIFRITALQLEDSTCVTLLDWIRSANFPPWTEVKALCPELRLLWHHRNNLSADVNGVVWRKRHSDDSQLQLPCTQTCVGRIVSGLSRFIIWGAFRPEPHFSSSESPVLLVWYGR